MDLCLGLAEQPRDPPEPDRPAFKPSARPESPAASLKISQLPGKWPWTLGTVTSIYLVILGESGAAGVIKASHNQPRPDVDYATIFT